MIIRIPIILRKGIYIFSLLFFNLFWEISNAHSQSNLYISDWISETESLRFPFTQKSLNLHTADGDLDARYYRIEVSINPDTLFISGKGTIYFVSKVNTSFPEFDLSKDLKVDSVIHRGIRINQTRTLPDRIGCFLPNNVVSGQLDSVTIYYQGSPSFSGMGSFMKDYQGGYPVIWTLSQPYGAKDWWPCRNSLGDKADSLDLHIMAPQTYQVAANGILKDSMFVDTNILWHYQHRYPIAPYLVALSITKYITYTDSITLPSGKKLVQENMVYPEDESIARIATAGLIPAIQKISQVFGDYPFAAEKYGHAQFGRGGGMEHQTMSFVGSFRSRDLLVHELAHQWFGDLITCQSWPDLWLNEGFATYLTGLSYEWHNTALDFLNWKMGAVGQIVSQPDGSVYTTDTLNIFRLFSGRLTYTKGAMVLHMLRKKLGDSTFFNGIKTYLYTPGIRYGFASTRNFMDVMQNASGLALDTFFSEWIYGEGYPSYHFRWRQEPGGRISGDLTQSTSHNSVPFFHHPVTIRCVGQGKSIDYIVYPKSNKEVYTFSPPFRTDTIFLDPEFDMVAQKEVTDLNSISSIPLVHIFPNPHTGNFKVSAKPGFLIENLEIYTPEGKLMFHLKPLTPEGEMTINMLSKSTLGPLFVRITLTNGTQIVFPIIGIK